VKEEEIEDDIQKHKEDEGELHATEAFVRGFHQLHGLVRER
jgi:hypothetical protein